MERIEEIRVVVTPAHLRAMARAGFVAGNDNPVTWLVDKVTELDEQLRREIARQLTEDAEAWGLYDKPASTPEPAPVPATGDVWQTVIDTLPAGPIRDACIERRAFGIAKYGTPLQAFNGRNWRKDAVQEQLDLVAYGAQGEMEGDHEGYMVKEQALTMLSGMLTPKDSPQDRVAGFARFQAIEEPQHDPDLTTAEMRLVGRLLEMAADEFSNHGCNDFQWPADFPASEREALVRRMEHANNPDPARAEEVEESVERYTGKYAPSDCWLMGYFSDVFLKAGDKQ